MKSSSRIHFDRPPIERIGSSELPIQASLRCVYRTIEVVELSARIYDVTLRNDARNSSAPRRDATHRLDATWVYRRLCLHGSPPSLTGARPIGTKRRANENNDLSRHPGSVQKLLD